MKLKLLILALILLSGAVSMHPHSGPPPGTPPRPVPAPRWPVPSQTVVPRPMPHTTPWQIHPVHSTPGVIPNGGWRTSFHHNWPDLRTCVVGPGLRPHGHVRVRDYWTSHWGPGWWLSPYGFYWNNNFWLGWPYPTLWTPAGWTTSVYVWSPISQYEYGTITAPPYGFASDDQVELEILTVMEPEGLYAASSPFDAAMPGRRLSAREAFSLLAQGQPVLCHAPGGAWETLSNLGDLRMYMYLRESH